jgi:sulfate permease, SulP family
LFGCSTVKLPHAGAVDAIDLSKPSYLRDLFARSRYEFALAAIVIAGELTLGVLHGIAAGVVVALLMLIYRTSHPRGAVLGQLPNQEAYRSVSRHPEALTFPGLLIWRAGGDLFFASIGHLDEGLKAALAASRPPASLGRNAMDVASSVKLGWQTWASASTASPSAVLI